MTTYTIDDIKCECQADYEHGTDNLLALHDRLADAGYSQETLRSILGLHLYGVSAESLATWLLKCAIAIAADNQNR